MKTNPKNRSNRLHKKLYTGPYQIMGFHFEVLFEGIPAQDDFERHDAFWEEYAYPIGLSGCSSGGAEGDNERMGGYICGNGRYQSATEADRQAFFHWLTGRDDVIQFTIGPLEDAWYPDDEEYYSWKKKECVTWER